MTKLKHLKRVILQKLDSINLLWLVVISGALFVVVKNCYWLAENYTSEYWYVLYYLPDYMMKMTGALLIRSYMISKEYKLYALYWVLYFGLMMLLHIACLFQISLYSQWVSGAGYFGIDALVMVIGFTWLFYKIRKYVRRNK